MRIDGLLNRVSTFRRAFFSMARLMCTKLP